MKSKSAKTKDLSYLSKIVISIVAIAGVVLGQANLNTLVNDAVNPVKTAQAQAYPHTFKFGLHIKDGNCSNTHTRASSILAGAGNVNGTTIGQSTYYTDDNTEDPDCISMGLYVNNGNTGENHFNSIPVNQSVVNQDFRIGIRLSEKGSSDNCQGAQGTTRWTPWASEGGGSSSAATTAPGWDRADCAWMFFEQRPMPSGVLIKNFRAGVSSGNGPMMFSDWARSTPTQTDSYGVPSRWSGHSIGSDRLDPTRIQLDVQFVEIYDAEYVSDTVPATMVGGQSGNYTVVMRNKATAWTSDYPYSNTCPPPQPTAEGQICNWSGNTSSSLFKLKRIDNDSAISLVAPTGSSPLNYNVGVSRDYYVSYECVQWETPPPPPGDVPPGGIEPPILNYLDDVFSIKSAKADLGDYCVAWDYVYYLNSQNPANLNITNNSTANFPLSISLAPGISDGTHTLRFIMVQLNGSGQEIQQFGTEAQIPINVGIPGFTITCTPVATTIVAGSTTSFNITTSSSGGFSNPITVSHSMSPSSGTVPTIAYTNNGQIPPATTTATVTTTASTTAGSYTIVFSATSGATTQTCNVSLEVTAAAQPGYSFTISPVSADVLSGNTYDFIITANCANGAPGPIYNLSASSPYPNLTYSFYGTGKRSRTPITSLACGASGTLSIGNTGSINSGQYSTPQQRLGQTITVNGYGQ